GAAHARPKRAQPAEMRGVAIRAEDQFARQDNAFLTVDLMADAAPHLKKGGDALLFDKLAHFGMILRVLCRRRGHSVVERDCQPFGVPDFLDAEFLERLVDRGGIVVAQGHVGAGIDDLPGSQGGQPGSARQGFLGKGGRSHDSSSRVVRYRSRTSKAWLSSAASCSTISGGFSSPLSSLR